MAGQCTAVHKLMNARCVNTDDVEGHQNLGHKAEFEGVPYFWRPTTAEWARWQHNDKDIRWPEYDSDPVRRLDKQDFFTAFMWSKATKVVVATGSPETPWANVLSFSEKVFPDGTCALVLEL